MSNLIPLEEAARLLGLTVEKVNEMRSNSEIFGYKDGASWKFKMQELERVADEFDFTINTGSGSEAVQGALDLADDDFDLSAIDDDEQLSFDLSDSSPDLLSAGDEPAIDIAASEESGELKLEGDDDFSIKADDKAVVVDEPAAAESGELSFGSSDIHLASDGSSGNLLDDEEPGKGDPSTGKLLGDDDDGDELLLSEEDLFEDELTIQESHEDSIDLSSDFESSSDVIIDDSDSSAEVVADDSGELLSVESESDLSLSGSGLIELAEGDDDMIVLDEPADLDDPTQLGDDDFNLTPVEAVDDEEMESSGSQIIALEDSEMYDESSATLLSTSDEIEATPMLTDDAMDVGDFGAFDTGMVPGIPGASHALPEIPYTGMQIAALGLVIGLLGLGSVIAYDLARNLWLPEDQIISGGILPGILSILGFSS